MKKAVNSPAFIKTRANTIFEEHANRNNIMNQLNAIDEEEPATLNRC